MTFGTADRRKADVAEGVALAVGHVATQRGNRLGIVTFGGPADRRMPPSGGRQGLLSALLAARNDAAARRHDGAVGTRSPAAALRFLARRAPRGGLVVLVSDFRGPRDWLTRPRGRRRPLTRSSSSRSVIRARTSCPTSAS